MGEISRKEVTRDESERLAVLLEEHQVAALVAKHTPRGLKIGFDLEWLKDNALAASFPRTNTAGPYNITLSPLLLEWGLTDQIAFSTIVLHELGHVVDRVQNWKQHGSMEPQDHEAFEYAADDFVVACGWKDSLVETLRRSISLGSKAAVQEGMAKKRLTRLLNTV
jgi:hypothetical protein